MKKIVKIIALLVLASLLVGIRAFENELFYDPLLNFFKMDYKTMPLPKMNILALHAGITLRFWLNTLISLGILWVVFKDRSIIKLSFVLYGLLFVVLILAFSFILISSGETDGHWALFYVRRFLIQPLFLLILLPAFYFQKYKSR